MKESEKPSLSKLFLEFFKLGFIAFGGPAAHVALMEREIVYRRGWISQQLFLDFMGSVNLIPGPNSTQMTMLAGYKLRGFRGMLATGFGFIIPAVVLTGMLAWLYVSLGHLPSIEAFFFGLKPAVIAVITGAIIQLGRKAIKNSWLALLAAGVLAATLLGLGEIAAILGAGVLGMAVYGIHKGFRGSDNLKSLAPFLLLQAGGAAASQLTTLKLFLVFVKIGAVLFGSGYVLVAYIDGELVQKLEWLSHQQLLDAIAIGQFTPGPVLTAATFVGYVLQGWTGALAATLGIFLPSFLFIVILYPIIPRLRKSPYTEAFLDSVNAAAVAVMISVTILMTIDVTSDWRAAAILVVALVVVMTFKKISSLWVILGGAALGFLLKTVA
ncbi:MAG: chromate efflux transporter [Bacteroidales bacterium]|nr:chromate efflux transporter [Bacteroidales bacterium]NLM91925.1 chromate efflux transporter [Bacteroidales bacterium]